MTLSPARPPVWLASGVRTPFDRVDGPLALFDSIGLSVPVVRRMIERLEGGRPDFAVWGAVIPNLTWSNIAREVMMDAGLDATIPAFSTIMACSTSMIGAFEAAGMIDGQARNLALVGGAESMSRIQLGLGQSLSDWIRSFQQARTPGDKLRRLGALKTNLGHLEAASGIAGVLKIIASFAHDALPPTLNVAVPVFMKVLLPARVTVPGKVCVEAKVTGAMKFWALVKVLAAASCA